MRSAVLVAVVAALVAVGAAVAGRGDPQERFTAADQARAKAMVLRKSDFSAAFKPSKSDTGEDPYCRALDESDLVITGEANSPDFGSQANVQFLSAGSNAQVYETVAQSTESWRRGTSTAGVACVRTGLRRLFATSGITLVSYRRVAFPRVAPQTVAFRGKIEGQGIPGAFEFVALRNGRAQVGLYFIGLPVGYPHSEEVRLARATASRMAKALRGS